MHVTLTVGNSVYTAVTNSNGVWQTTLSASNLLALGDGTATLTVNPLFTDNQLNLTELQAGGTLSGSYTNLPAGTQLTITIGSYTATGTTSAGGLWSATIPPNALSGLNDGSVQVSISAADSAGNPASASGTLDVVTHTTFNVTLNTPFIDGKLNATEAGVDQVLSGSTVLSTLSDGTVNVIVTVTDSVGNSTTTGSAEALFHALPSATAVLPFGDGYLNLDESTKPQTLSGKPGISGSGQTVTVTLDAGTANQQVFAGVQVDGLGGWSLPLTATQLAAFTEGGHTLLVTVTDKAGNPSSATVNVTAALTLPTPKITEPLFGDDNILNIAEARDTITITGTTNSTGSAQNISVEIDLNGVIYQAVVTGNTWSVPLPANALSSLAEGDNHKLIVTATDAAGNTASDTVTFENDFHAPAVTLDTPFGDGYLNATEIAALSGNAGDATIVMVTIGSNPPIKATITNGQWSLDATQLSGLSDGTQPLTVTAIDAAGNSASVDSQVHIARTLPTIAFDAFVGGDGLNYVESRTAQTLSGTSTKLEVGQKVTVTVNGHDYYTNIGVGGSWSVLIPASELQQFTNPTEIAIQAQDKAGNVVNETLDVPVNIVLPPDPTLVINATADDNIINVAESQAPITVSGVVHHGVNPGEQ
ncbi:Ig-like domain-containing protein [Candidatus Symbiopectobacterium endolongispinus]|uniref:Ig-like domain-containing protein n=1 Tax=Candidatus Symbiopectobacterium endolongispinus TaxID=2812664 RepID=UPI00207988A4|nr:Ig-like domain-containing protein [Candidatus Symbiopectobacterium endolongispinus]MBT9428330.1 hypothetical protein [Candidatus Symbiopectobacterium endolongispinus]